MSALTSSEVVRVEDGLLKMEAINYSDENDENISYATNISLTTADTLNFKYGYLEMYAKVPFKNGVWPSWWLKGVNEKRYQDNFNGYLAKSDVEYMPEVDIFENFGTTDTLTFNMHKWKIDSPTDFYNISLDSFGYDKSYTFQDSENLSEEFHTYGFEWTPDEMSVYVDGVKYFTYDLSVNFDATGKNTGMDCFHVPMYILLNNYLYTPEGGYSNPSVNPEDLPAEYYVDWIKLYQKSGVGELYTSYKKDNVVIFGDSYSTFEGYIPSGYPTWYYEGGSEKTDVTEVSQTWWSQVISETNSQLLLNNSWSGSTIGYTGYGGADESKGASFIHRFNTLAEQGFFAQNKVDTLFIFGGTNDDWANSPLGSLKYDNFSNEDLYNVLPAICYFVKTVKETLPDADIYFIINEGLDSTITNGIIAACEHYGVDSISLVGISKTSDHPNVQGMQQIKNQVLQNMK